MTATGRVSFWAKRPRVPARWTEKLSPIPDWGSAGQAAFLALVVWLTALITVRPSLPRLDRTLGDTDDALRLVLVRGLAHGHGWFEQNVERLQPPQGLYMHWSRLVDGVQAVILRLADVFLPQPQAEIALRVAWPLLWVGPLALALILIARRLGGGRAAFLAPVAIGFGYFASAEFLPGRLDHHGVQIALCMTALAAAAHTPRPLTAAISAAAAAATLAVGLEALPFLVVIGAGVALAWVFGRASGKTLAAYGATLGAGAALLHLLQTPSDRWLTPACDALAVNLVAALGVAALGLCAAAVLGARRPPAMRLALLIAAGLAAASTYVQAAPVCLGGPMAEVDPLLKTTWLVYVQEMQPLHRMFAGYPVQAVTMAAPAVFGLAGWLWLGRRAAMRTDMAWMLSGAVFLAALAMGLQACRFMNYAIWASAPLTAAAMVDFAGVALAGRLVPAVLVMMLALRGPAFVAERLAADQVKASAANAETIGLCAETAAYRRLAGLPPGLVLSEIDLGPYVLANTAHSAVEGPYHRMNWGVRKAWEALSAPASDARAQVQALGVDYVVNCAAHRTYPPRQGMPKGSLQAALDAGRPPAWLERQSPTDETLQIYRVR